MASQNYLTKVVGNSNGNYTNKYNRAQKLINNWDSIRVKMERMVTRGNGKTKLSQRAWLILLIMETGIRVGNRVSADGYISKNKYGKYFEKKVRTFGATTLKVKHCKVKDGVLSISFLGKKQVSVSVKTNNKILLKYFPELVKGKVAGDDLTSEEARFLNGFLKKRVGRYSAKDLRTAKVNLIYSSNAQFPDAIKNKSEANKIVKDVLVETAKLAGHTPGVCKSRYVSPDLIFFYKETLLSLM